MGETSAKQMRGSEMEDVIFSGAGTRPARNIAEVMLTLDNKTRTAPAMVNDSDQLDIVRRIERGHGSAYSVNGREIRARDVQTLFADAATGSRSTAMVSQGRIGALINAKPVDRRSVIDEAAGITGLYARRHEAELRLRAAEANLARVQDVLVALEEQHKGLKRQARQASRYRNLSDHIRRAEAAVLALKLARAESELADAGERLKEAEGAGHRPDPAWSASPPRRRPRPRPRCRRCAARRPAAAAGLQRLRVAHDALAAEAERVARRSRRPDPACSRPRGDLVRERGRKGDAENRDRDLDAQRAGLEQERVGEDERAAAARQARDAAQAATAAAEAEHDRLTRPDRRRPGACATESAARSPSCRSGCAGSRCGARKSPASSARSRPELASLPALVRGRGGAGSRAACLGGGAAAGRRGDRAGARGRALRIGRGAPGGGPRRGRAHRDGAGAAAERPGRRGELCRGQRPPQKANARLTKLRAEEAGRRRGAEVGGRLRCGRRCSTRSTVAPGFEKALARRSARISKPRRIAARPTHWLPLGRSPMRRRCRGVTPLARARQGAARTRPRLAFIGIVADDWAGLRCSRASSPASSW
jgi:chromosome segregation protein